MHIAIRFFAAHRDVLGTPTLALDVAEGTTAEAAFAMLCEQYPPLRSAASSVAFAVNQRQTSGSHVLSEGDELALLPPMAGG